MSRSIALSAISIILLGSAAQLAQSQQRPPPAMTFFVAANPTGTGNLSGLAGADQICQNAAPGPWRAERYSHVARLS